MLSIPDRETYRQPGQKTPTDVITRYLNQHIIPNPPSKPKDIQEILLQQFPNLHPTIYRDGQEAAELFLKEWVLNKEYHWHPVGFPDPETGFGEAIIHDKKTGKPTHYLYSSHQTPTHEKTFLGIAVPISEVDVVLSLNQMKNEDGRVLSVNQIIDEINPNLLSLEQINRQVENAELATRNLPGYIEYAESKKRLTSPKLERSFAREKMLEHFIQQAQLSDKSEHVATFEKAKQYGGAAYDYIDDHEMGNKITHAFMDEGNKLFFDTKGNRASLIDWLNEHYGQNGVSFSVSYKILEHQISSFLADLIKSKFYDPFRTTNGMQGIDENLAYLNNKPVPFLNITYSHEGKTYTRAVPILGIQTCDSLARGHHVAIRKDREKDHLAIQIDGARLTKTPADLVHEIDHAVRQLIQMDSLNLSRFTPGQDYDKVLAEGLACLAQESFQKTQQDVAEYQAKSIKPIYSMMMADRRLYLLDNTIEQAKVALAYLQKNKKVFTEKQLTSYWYLDGVLITEACRQLLPDRFFQLMYESPSQATASMIDLENTIGHLHQKIWKNINPTH